MQRFKDILCVMAPDLEDQDVLERAVGLAVNNKARLTVVEVVDEIPPDTMLFDRVMSPVDLKAVMVEEHRQLLDDLVTPWRNNTEIQIKILSGIPFLEITKEVLRNNRDLVIKTAESGGLLDRIFGSDDMHLLRKCPCPVWLDKWEAPKAYHRILAAVDVNDDYPPEELNTRHLLNLQILEMASSLSLSEFAELHIVHAWEAFGEAAMRDGLINRQEDEIVIYVEEVRKKRKKNLNVLVEQIISKLGQNAVDSLKLIIHLQKGNPQKEVPDLAREIEADLVVMGSVARTGIPGFFMGNTAETILNQLDCSLLEIKPQGFESPVTMVD